MMDLEGISYTNVKGYEDAVMLTRLGKFLRELRISHGEILMDMADNLGIRPSFLSAIETGKVAMPFVIKVRLLKKYQLTEAERLSFTAALAETELRMKG